MPRAIVTTERLTLRELCDDDLPFVIEVLGHDEVMRYWPSSFSPDGAREWFQKQQGRYAKDGCGYWLALTCDAQQSIGFVGVMMIEIDGESEHGLGWIIHQPFQCRGLATEAARGCMKYADEQLDVQRIVAPIRPENDASIAVARKLNMIVEKRTMFAGFEHLIYVNR